MNKTFSTLQIRQMEDRLKPWRALPPNHLPKGWLRAVRETLCMTPAQLGRRLRVSRQAVADVERRETDGSVTIAVMQKAARALGCEFVYALVPRQDLHAIVEQQATVRATAEIKSVAHSMSLEAQNVSAGETQRQIADYADKLLRTRPRSIWNPFDE
jgi:predicted DNA-binding mobile mystery protein A